MSGNRLSRYEDFGGIEVKELAPKSVIPPHEHDGEKVIWKDPDEKISFKMEDIAGVGCYHYGAVFVVQIEGDSRHIEKWTNFFANHLDCHPRRMYSAMPGYRVFYTYKDKFREAIRTENLAARIMRREHAHHEERENMNNSDSEKYAEQFMANLPQFNIDCSVKYENDN